MPRRDYIPATDDGFANWSDNFATVITATPTVYGLDAGQASSYTTLSTAYLAALAAATNPGTRTPVTVAAKDIARNQAVALGRQLGQIARKFPSITDELLADAGLTIPDVVPSPIPAPTSSPVLSILQLNSGQVVLRYRDSVLSNRSARPDGATSMQLFAKVGGTAPVDISTMTFVGNMTRMPSTVGGPGNPFQLPANTPNAAAWFIGRWSTARGLVGPISNILATTVAA